jgi:hypothetical protein
MKESPLASLPMTPLMRRTIGAPALVKKTGRNDNFQTRARQKTETAMTATERSRKARVGKLKEPK